MPIRIIDELLKTDASPLAFLVTLHSLVFGGSFVLFAYEHAVNSLILFKLGALISVPIWGWIVFISAIVLFIGLAWKKTSLVLPGSFMVALCWVFAAIIYFQFGYWLQAILAIITSMYFAYFFLAASIGRLWNYTPDH